MDHLGSGLTGLRFRNLLEVEPSLQEQVRLWRNSDPVRGAMVCQDPISPQAHLRWLENLREREERQEVRVAFQGDTPFGVVTLKDRDRTSGTSDWGFYIGAPAFLRRGLGRGLLYEILHWGFEEEALRRLYTSVLGSNPRALTLYLEAGFALEGCWRRHVRTPEGPRDLYWVACFREDWTSRRDEVARRLLSRESR